MSVWHVIILGLVQGLTEFLPVSSSGHLIVARMVFGIPDISGTTFDAFLHLGTLLALVVYYWRVWVGMVRAIWNKDAESQDKRELAVKLAIATIPGALAGYFFQGVVEDYLRAPAALVGGFVVTALVLVIAEVGSKRATTTDRANFRDAFWIGLAQVTALVPSISRSGVTIAAGQALRLSRKQATTFSFLMAAPIIAGAGLASLSSLVAGHLFSPMEFVVGFLMSFVAGLAGIFLLMRMSERIGFWPFAVYLVVLSGVLMYVAS